MPAATYTVEPCPQYPGEYDVKDRTTIESHYSSRAAAQARADALNAERVLTPQSYAAVFGSKHCACTGATCPTWSAGFNAAWKAAESAEQVTP